MKLAVVIPVYNHARYVPAAIDSVLGQTRKPNRIVAIDDGSRDDSLAVLRGFESQGVEVHTQPNQGAHATINRGITLAAADCDLIAILNSDDHYDRQRFEQCVPVLERDNEAAVVASALRYIDEAGDPLPDDHPRGRWLRAVWSRWGTPEPNLAEWMGQSNFVVTSSNIIARREFLLAHPFKSYRFNHDYYFLAQAAIRGALRVVPQLLVNYRVHSSNTINTEPAPLMRELLLQHVELHRDLAGDLIADPELRARFYRYMRGAWDNVSALHAGVLQTLLAQSAAGRDAEHWRQLIAVMDEVGWPELGVFPNRQLVNSFDGHDPFIATGGSLADRIESLRAERDAARARASASRELARLRRRLLASRWAAAGRLFGLARHLGTDSGSTPEEKLSALRSAIRGSRWLKLGRWRDEAP